MEDVGAMDHVHSRNGFHQEVQSTFCCGFYPPFLLAAQLGAMLHGATTCLPNYRPRTHQLFATTNKKGPWAPCPKGSRAKSQREVEDMLQRVSNCRNCGTPGHRSGQCGNNDNRRVIEEEGVFVDPQIGHIEI